MEIQNTKKVPNTQKEGITKMAHGPIGDKCSIKRNIFIP